MYTHTKPPQASVQFPSIPLEWMYSFSAYRVVSDFYAPFWSNARWSLSVLGVMAHIILNIMCKASYPLMLQPGSFKFSNGIISSIPFTKNAISGILVDIRFVAREPF